MGLLDDTKIYVGTYAKYNNGSIDGEWLTLGDYSDMDEFWEACKELHNDEEDPEFMFQDYETPELLDGLISESGIDADIFEKAEILDKVEDFGDSDWMQIQAEFDPDSQLFVFDDEFFNIFFADKPMEAARAASFGNLNWSDDYIYFNGYGNLESTSDITSVIDKRELVDYYLENEHYFSF